MEEQDSSFACEMSALCGDLRHSARKSFRTGDFFFDIAHNSDGEQIRSLSRLMLIGGCVSNIAVDDGKHQNVEICCENGLSGEIAFGDAQIVDHECYFKLFCHLAEGDNTLRFSAFIGDEVLTASLCVTYATHTDAPLYSFPQLLHEQNPSVTRRMTCASESAVRFIYALGSDGDGTMQAPDEDPSDVVSACRRIATGGILLQSLTAQLMYESCGASATFSLESDFVGEPYPRVHVLRCLQTVEQLLALSGQDLYNCIAGNLVHWQNSGMLQTGCYKNIVILSFSSYTPPTQKSELDRLRLAPHLKYQYILGHTALGGGDLGVFGGASLFTWPLGVDEIQARIKDERQIDIAHYFADGGGSQNSSLRCHVFSTSLGAVLHELGHCLGLPHTPAGIMRRGFDHLRQYACCGPVDNHPFRFVRTSALRLLSSQWIKLSTSSAASKVESAASCHGVALKPGNTTVVRSEQHGGHPSIKVVDSFCNWRDLCVSEKSKPYSCFQLHSIRLHYDVYLNAIDTTYRARRGDSSTWDLVTFSHGNRTGRSSLLELTDDQWVENLRLRKGAWIDGIQVVLNTASPSLYGGNGGELAVLDRPPKKRFLGFCGTAGESNMVSLGAVWANTDSNVFYPGGYYDVQGENNELHDGGTIAYVAGSSTVVGAGPGAPPAIDFDDMVALTTEFGPSNASKACLNKIVVAHGQFVHGIRRFYECEGRTVMFSSGDFSSHQQVSTIAVTEANCPAELVVRSGAWVDSIEFLDSHNQSIGSYGGSGGIKHILRGKPACRLAALRGSFSHNVIVSIGAHWKSPPGTMNQEEYVIASSSHGLTAVLISLPDCCIDEHWELFTSRSISQSDCINLALDRLNATNCAFRSKIRIPLSAIRHALLSRKDSTGAEDGNDSVFVEIIDTCGKTTRVQVAQQSSVFR